MAAGLAGNSVRDAGCDVLASYCLGFIAVPVVLAAAIDERIMSSRRQAVRDTETLYCRPRLKWE